MPAPSRATSGLLRATVTLLMGGALAQLVPLLLGPVLARLFTPQAFGVFTTFSTVAATVAVVACGRYEFALPMARDEDEAAVLLALCVRIGCVRCIGRIRWPAPRISGGAAGAPG